MGRIVVEQIISADGYAAAAGGGIDFMDASGAMRDPEVEAEQLRMLDSVGAIVLGRNTYRMFEAYWPDMPPDREPVAAPINALPKYVVSSTLAAAPWGRQGDIGILRGDGVDAVLALRGRIEGDIIVWGSLMLSEALLRAGAVDLLRLRMLPVLLGQGRPFAPPGLGQCALSLVSVRGFPLGAVLLAYRPL